MYNALDEAINTLCSSFGETGSNPRDNTIFTSEMSNLTPAMAWKCIFNQFFWKPRQKETASIHFDRSSFYITPLGLVLLFILLRHSQVYFSFSLTRQTNKTGFHLVIRNKSLIYNRRIGLTDISTF